MTRTESSASSKTRLEVVDRAFHEGGGRQVLDQRHDDVMDFEIIGKRDDIVVPGLERDWLVVEGPVPDIFESRLRKVIKGLERLRQPWPEPAARWITGEGLDRVTGSHDGVPLVIQLMHGYLIPGMAIEFPIQLKAGGGYLRIFFANPAVHGDGRPDVHILEQTPQPSETDPHAVFVPRPVGDIRYHGLVLGRRQDRSRHGSLDVPDLQ